MLSDEAFGGGVRTKNDIDRALSRWFLMNRGLINFSSAKAAWNRFQSKMYFAAERRREKFCHQTEGEFRTIRARDDIIFS